MKKQYGTFLLVWLIISMVFVSSAIVMNVIAGLFLPKLVPTFASWVYFVSAFAAAIYLLALIFLLLWKKWALYLAMAVALALLIFNLAIGVGIFFSIIGLIGPGILLWAVLRKWKLFV